MKRMTCEMCGSTNLIKENGVFVCQNCGTQYSVEEAKKLMIEGTDEVTETVVVDNSSEIQALKKVAYMSLENAFQTGVWDVVAINFQKVLEKDPTDWRGNFYPHFIDYKNAIASPDVNRIVKQHDIIKESYRMAISLIKETESEENQKTCYQEVFDRFIDLCHIYYKMLLMEEIIYRERIDDLSWNVNLKMFIEDCEIISTCVIKNFEDYEFSIRCFERLKEEVFKTDEKRNWELIEKTNHHIITLQKEYEEKKKETERRQKQKYWEEHPEEKVALEIRLAEIEDIKKEYNTEYDGLSSKKQQIEKELRDAIEKTKYNSNNTRDLVSKLEKDKSRLGLFSGKQKKELQSQIDELYKKLEELRKEEDIIIQGHKAESESKTNETNIKMYNLKQKYGIDSLEAESSEIKKKLSFD